MNTADLIRTMRESSDFSMRELGRRIGVDAGLISRWEHGITRPSAEHLMKVCEATGYEIIIRPKYNRNFYGGNK